MPTKSSGCLMASKSAAGKSGHASPNMSVISSGYAPRKTGSRYWRFMYASARRVAARSSSLSESGYFGSMFTTMPMACLPTARYASTALPCARSRLCEASGASKRLRCPGASAPWR